MFQSSSLKIFMRFLFTCLRVLESTVPSRPKARSLSSVANFESLKIESRLSPFASEGFSRMSLPSILLSWVEIKASVISVGPVISNNAGLVLLPDKSENGNGIRTISPLIIGIFLSDLQQYINPLHHSESKTPLNLKSVFPSL